MKTDLKIQIYVLLLLTGLAAVISCSRSVSTNVERGSGYLFREGFPEARILAVGMFDEENKSVIEITTDIVKGSIIYRSVDHRFEAGISISYQIIRVTDREKQLIGSQTRDFVVTDTNQQIVHSPEIFTFVERFYLEPGRYEVTTIVSDATSKKQITRSTISEIPDPNSSSVGITGIQVLGFSNDRADLIPITTYDVPARFDSLIFRFSLVRPETVDIDTKLRLRLISYSSDTLPAREMAGIPVNPGSLPYRGIDYGSRNEVTSEIMTFSENNGIIHIDLPVVIPVSGNFRFDVTVNDDDKDQKAREFSIKSSNYPSVMSVNEFASPLVYLMSRRDYQRLMSITDPVELKREVDRFWLSNIKNRSRAAQVINMYYNRIEEANKQFSNFKEGWKTDMGMVYILFGPPWYVENTIDSSIWYYSYNRNDLRYTIRFYRPRIADQHFPFQHYILIRERYYHNIEYEQIRNWLTGAILTTEG